MKDLMMGAFTKFFNKTEDEIGELIFDGENLKDGALDALVSLDAERISRIKQDATGDTTKKFDDGYKKAQKEIMGKFESEFKEATGFDSDLNGIDLVRAWGESLGGESEVTAENIKTHPEFLKIETRWNAEKKEALDALSNEFEQFKSNVEREKVMGGIREMAKNEFLKLNPVLSKDKAKADAQTNMFLQRFDAYNYEKADDGYIIMDGDKRLEDAHGNRVQFANFVKDEASRLFDFQVQDPKGSPGNTTPTGGAGGKTVLSKDEWNKKINETNGDPALMNEVAKNYTRAD